MAYKTLFVVLCVGLFACSSPVYKNPHIVIETQYGDIEVELFQDEAPITTKAVLGFIEKDLYKGASFYRVLNEDNQPSGSGAAALIQGGVWKKAGNNDQLITPIPHETTAKTHILHTDGTLSMARQAPGTATTEFFICVGDQPGFDFGGGNNPDGQGYAAFGRVVKGMGIVQKIYSQPSNGELFQKEIFIKNIERL